MRTRPVSLLLTQPYISNVLLLRNPFVKQPLLPSPWSCLCIPVHSCLLDDLYISIYHLSDLTHRRDSACSGASVDSSLRHRLFPPSFPHPSWITPTLVIDSIHRQCINISCITRHHNRAIILCRVSTCPLSRTPPTIPFLLPLIISFVTFYIPSLHNVV